MPGAVAIKKIGDVVSKGLDTFNQAPPQVQKQIEAGDEQGVKYLEGQHVKRQEIDQLTSKEPATITEEVPDISQPSFGAKITETTDNPNYLGKAGEDPYTKKELGQEYDYVTPQNVDLDTYEEIGYKLPSGMLTEDAKATRDHWNAGISAHARRDVHGDALRVLEVQSDMQNQLTKRSIAELDRAITSFAKENDIPVRMNQVGVIRDQVKAVKNGQKKLEELPSNAEFIKKFLAEAKLPTPKKLSQYRLKITEDTINRQFKDAANQGLKYVDFLIKPDGDYMARTAEVQKNYETRVAKTIKTLAKKLKGPNGEEAKAELVDKLYSVKQRTPITKENAAQMVHTNYLNGGMPDAQVDRLVENALTELKKTKPRVYADYLAEAEAELTSLNSMDIFDTAMRNGAPIGEDISTEAALRLAKALQPKVNSPAFDSEIEELANREWMWDEIADKGGWPGSKDILDYDASEADELAKVFRKLGMADIATNVAKSAKDSSQYMRVTLPFTAAGTVAAFSVPAFAEESQESKVANLPKRTSRAVKDGVPASTLFKALQESDYDLPVIQSALGGAIKPKVEQMRADGVPEESIIGALQDIGIIPSAPYSDPTAEIDKAIGMQGPDENNSVTDESDTLKTLFDPDEMDNLVQRVAPADKLDINAKLDLLSTDLTPEELVTNINNISITYEQMGKEFIGWSGLSSKYKYEVKQKQNQLTQVLVTQLQQRGVDVVGVNEYGEAMIRNEETGEVEAIEDGILDSVLANKYELGGALTGAITGGRAGFIIGGPWGALSLGTVGSALGAYTGRGADVITAARDMQYELQTRELLAKMNDAGTADVVFGLGMGSAFQLIKGTWKAGKLAGRGLAKGWDLFVGGNKEGATKAMIDNLGLTEAQAIEVITRWEKLNNVKVLSKKARATGRLGIGDTDTVLSIISETTPGAEQMVKAAAEKSKYAGTKLAKQIAKRADDVVKQAEDATNDNIGTIVREHLDNYVATTKDYFENVKTLGVESMKDTSYHFTFDDTTLVKQMREYAKGLHNSALSKDFYSYVDRIKELGTPEARKLIGKAAKEIETAKELKETPQLLEAANPYRDFNSLLELRKTINKLRSDTRFKDFAQFKQMEIAMRGIDDEIARAAKNFMPNGDTWLRQWKMANTEYSKMKTLEKNFLQRMITKGTATPEAIVNSMTKYLQSESPETFMQVMGKLPPDVRKPMEGAIYKKLVKQHTVGFEGGKQAVHFTKLASDLEKIAFTQLEARNMKRMIREFAEVYKNDPQLLIATGNMPLPKFQSYLTADPVIRLKYEVASQMFNWVKSRIPFSNNAGRAALLNNLSKVLDNPKDAVSVDRLIRQLGNDPELKTQLHKLAIEYAKVGYPENYGKVPVYRVASDGNFDKASNTSIGRGVLFYTDKNKAQQIAKETGAKMKEVKLTHKTIATPEDVERILGFKPTKADLQDAEVIDKIKRGGWLGVAMEDKVVKFK